MGGEEEGWWELAFTILGETGSHEESLQGLGKARNSLKAVSLPYAILCMQLQ